MKNILYKIYKLIINNKLTAVTVLIFITCLFAGFVVYRTEITNANADITNFWDGFYWAIVTFTSTGYGDMSPKTPGGKLIAALFMLLSAVLLALATALIASFLVEKTIKEGRGLTTITENGHMIICGWNDFAFQILKRVELDENNRETSTVVLVNNFDEGTFHSLEAQFSGLHLYHIKGDYTVEGTLNRANIKKAGPIVLLADKSNSNSYERADERTILAALTMKSMAPKAKITAEILNHMNRSHAKRAGIQSVILRGEHSGAMLASASLAPGIAIVLNQLMSTSGPQIMKVDIPKKFLGKPLVELADHYRESQNLLLSIISEDQGIDIDDILSDDMSAIDHFIKTKFEESQKKFSSTKTLVNPPMDYIITEFDSAVILTNG